MTRWCSSSTITHVIPFRLLLQPGVPIFEQVVYAAKRAVVSGQLRPGDSFPSVRTLSRELKINPNTAHKVVTALISEGVLEVMPGIGTVVAKPVAASAAERTRLLREPLEQLVVESKRLGLKLADVTAALENHWERLHPGKAGPREPAKEKGEQ